MKRMAVPGILVLCFAFSNLLFGGIGDLFKNKKGVASHPDHLVFPELEYEPPSAAGSRIELPGGAVCFMKRDAVVPIVNVVVYIRADDRLVPEGESGLHGAAMELLSESGSVTHTAEWIEDQVEFLGAELSSRTGSYGGTVKLNLLSKDLEQGLDILFELLRAPAYQEDRLDVWRDRKLSDLRTRNDSSSSIESIEWKRLIYDPEDPRARFSTLSSINSITRDKLINWHRRWFVPGNFVFTVSGDFEEKEMVALLESHIANWEGDPYPFQESPPLYSDAEPGVYIVNKDVNQGRVRFALPGLDRDEPEWFAASIALELLGGGGGIRSRLGNRIRGEEGLAYHISAGLQEIPFGPGLLSGLFQSKSESVVRAMKLTVEEFGGMAGGNITEKEVEDIKNSMIEAFPTKFSEPSIIAGKFASEELSGRLEKDPAYYREYRNRIEAVTIEDVKKSAAELLRPDGFIWLVVGDTAAIRTGDGTDETRLEDFGPVTTVTLRDPMTQEPLILERSGP